MWILGVQTNYQEEHVPIISLMSQLNGKVIVGASNPNGSIGRWFISMHLSSNDDLGNDAFDNNKKIEHFHQVGELLEGQPISM